jgi:4-amino-4-deoxy-L-arabinose transferase-like glycosyltransferase
LLSDDGSKAFATDKQHFQRESSIMDAVARNADFSSTSRRCRWAAACLIGGALLLRLAYLAIACPIDLAPDEAHYWDWSRHLDWSYYSKGPGVAWLIRFSCELFGWLSAQLTGTEMLAVRLPAVVCGSLLLVSLYVLTVQVSGSDRLSLLVVAVALTTPLVSAGSTLMTIDSPYTCCWGWALVLVHRAIFRPSAVAWWLAGVVVALGILCKYTMVLWVPSLTLFLLFSPAHRWLLGSRHFWGMTLVAASGGLPIVIWNMQHDWVGFRHVSGLAGLQQESTYIQWLGPLWFVAAQCGLWLVFWFVVWVRAMLAHAPWKPAEPPQRFLWWMSAPMFGVFLLFSFKTGGGEPNWPVTAYISGIVLGGPWLVEELRVAGRWYWRGCVGGMAVACLAGVALTVALHYSAWLHPLLAPMAGPVTAQQPFPLRRLDPTLRLRGWRALAVEVDKVRRQIVQQHSEPVLATTGWSMPGLLGFYCAGHPQVYSLGLAVGDRWSQYDFWRPNPVWDAEQFAGQTFLVVTANPLDTGRVFDHVETLRVVEVKEHGYPIGRWVILLCRGYRGFGEHGVPGQVRHY